MWSDVHDVVFGAQESYQESSALAASDWKPVIAFKSEAMSVSVARISLWVLLICDMVAFEVFLCHYVCEHGATNGCIVRAWPYCAPKLLALATAQLLGGVPYFMLAGLGYLPTRARTRLRLTLFKKTKRARSVLPSKCVVRVVIISVIIISTVVIIMSVFRLHPQHPHLAPPHPPSPSRGPPRQGVTSH